MSSRMKEMTKAFGQYTFEITPELIKPMLTLFKVKSQK